MSYISVRHRYPSLIWLVLAVAIAMMALAAWNEYKYPCVAYGEERLIRYDHIGDSTYPVYGRDCIERTVRK